RLPPFPYTPLFRSGHGGPRSSRWGRHCRRRAGARTTSPIASLRGYSRAPVGGPFLLGHLRKRRGPAKTRRTDASRVVGSRQRDNPRVVVPLTVYASPRCVGASSFCISALSVFLRGAIVRTEDPVCCSGRRPMG